MGTTAIMLLSFLIAAQTSSNTFKGQVVEKGNGKPIPGATISFGNQQISANEQGLFTIKAFKKTNFNISSVGFENGSFTIPSNLDQVHIFELKPFQLFLQPLEVKAIRASDRSPFTKTNLNKSAINKLNLGTDIPFLLNQTPAVVINADAGNGVGYTGIRIRGTDATRINVTLNGIPYN